jgi:hypothetical protein
VEIVDNETDRLDRVGSEAFAENLAGRLAAAHEDCTELMCVVAAYYDVCTCVSVELLCFEGSHIP